MNRSPNKYILALTLVAFALRLAYAVTSHPFIDEFTTVFAAQRILQTGWPILPSGLFYEHGLLFSYLDAPFVALAGEPPLFLLARLPSLFIGTILVPLLYQIGRRWFSPQVGLVAAALLTISPEGMVWGGRVRMYALATLLILGLIYVAYKSATQEKHPSNQTFRRSAWLTILLILAVLLTQFGAILFLPPLFIAMTTLQWMSRQDGQLTHRSAITLSTKAVRLLPFSVPELIGFGCAIGLGILIKRLGQPLGVIALSSEPAGNIVVALWNTLAYQAGIVLDYGEAIKFLGRQFGVPHHLWLAATALIGLTTLFFSVVQGRGDLRHQLPYFFLWLIFGLVVLEIITLVKPFRRNPRYLVIGLPLFYLIVAASLNQLYLFLSALKIVSRSGILKNGLWPIIIICFMTLHSWGLWTGGLWRALRIAYNTPEPAYDAAFQFVAEHRQPDSVVLTMHPTAAALYLGDLDYFAMQSDAEQFLLHRTTVPVDRWLGVPWLGSVEALNRLLNETTEAWFIIDTTRLPVYYRGDWQTILTTQMDLAWSFDEALVYRTKFNRSPLPTNPDTHLSINLDNQIILLGYAGAITRPSDTTENRYQLTLFWQALTAIAHDYTVFVHIRDQAGALVAQRDSRPLHGRYLTTQWRVAETIIDPHSIPLPSQLSPGDYQVWVGLYRLDTLKRLPVTATTDNTHTSDNAILLGILQIQ